MFEEFVEEKVKSGGLYKKETTTLYYDVKSGDNKYVAMVSKVKLLTGADGLSVRVVSRVNESDEYLQKCNQFNCSSVGLVASVSKGALTISGWCQSVDEIDTLVVQMIFVLKFLG